MNDGTKKKKHHRIDYLDIRILDEIYNKEITVMKLIINHLKEIATRKTISKRIKILSNMRFIKLIENTNPLCIQRKLNDKEIKEFIQEQKKKWGI